MKPWKIYNRQSACIITKFKNSKSIIEALGERLPDFYSEKKRHPVLNS